MRPSPQMATYANPKKQTYTTIINLIHRYIAASSLTQTTQTLVRKRTHSPNYNNTRNPPID